MTNTLLPATLGVTPTFGNNFDRFIARGIQWATATRKDYTKPWENAKVNHAVIYVGEIEGFKKPQLVQAGPGGANFSDWDSYGDSMIWLHRMSQIGTGVELTPTDDQRELMVAWACDVARRKVGYNYLDFVAIAMAQQRFGQRINYLDPPWWVKRLSDNNHLICSQLDDQAWHFGGIEICKDGRPSGLVSPADLLSCIIL